MRVGTNRDFQQRRRCLRQDFSTECVYKRVRILQTPLLLPHSGFPSRPQKEQSANTCGLQILPNGLVRMSPWRLELYVLCLQLYLPPFDAVQRAYGLWYAPILVVAGVQ